MKNVPRNSASHAAHGRDRDAPVGWLTPHYLATPVAYQQFARMYPFALDRGIFFANDSTGKTQAVELNSPFVYRDTYGLKRIPETWGN